MWAARIFVGEEEAAGIWIMLRPEQGHGPVFIACAHVWVKYLRYIFRPFTLSDVHAPLSSRGGCLSTVGRDPTHPRLLALGLLSFEIRAGMHPGPSQL